MIKYYLALTVRNFQKGLFTNIINILGLSAGFVCVFFISVWVTNELSYDRFHEKINDLYIMTSRFQGTSDYRPQSPFYSPQHEIYNAYPEVSAHTTTITLENSTISNNNVHLNSRGIAATISFFEIFDFEFLHGGLEGISDSSKVIFLTRKMSERLFGSTDVLGNIITFRSDQELTIGGILADPPINSSIKFDFIVPYYAGPNWSRIPQDYILLSPGTKMDAFNKKISSLGQGLVADADKKESALFPFQNIYFDSSFSEFSHGNYKYVLILIVLAIVILIATIVNYVNLMSSQLATRYKEFSVRMLIGSRRDDLYKQFIVETLFNILVTLMCSIVLVQLLTPAFYTIVGDELSLHFFGSEFGVIYLALSLIGISIICGSVLARYFSVIKPILNSQLQSPKLSGFKGKLIIIQFIIATVGIIMTMTLDRQLDYMMSKDPGYDKENIVKLKLSTRGSKEAREQNVEYVNSELKKSSVILNFDRGDFPTSVSNFPWQIVPNRPAESMAMLAVGSDFIELFDIQLVDGEDVNSLNDKVLVNESAVREFDIKNPIGHKISNSSWGDYQIAGVVKDFHFESSGLKVKPLVIVCQPYNERPVIVKIAKGRTGEALAFLKEIHSKVNPEEEFIYQFFDQEFDSIYRRDTVLNKIFGAATIVAVVVSVVGLFSLILAFTQEKTREIGIRKVYGAQTIDIVSNISLHFLKKILISFTIAGVVSYIILKMWLENFENKIELNITLFVAAGLIVFTISIITISFQIFSVARQNPVKSLRHI